MATRVRRRPARVGGGPMRAGLLGPSCVSQRQKNIYTVECITSQDFVYAGRTDADRRADSIHESATPVRHPRRRPAASRCAARSSCAAACAAAGFDVTQATLSRDIRELGLVKGGADGAYQAPPRSSRTAIPPKAMLQRALASQLRRIDRVQQLVLLRTGLGQAQSLVRRARRRRAAGRGRDAGRRGHDSRHHARTPGGRGRS